MYQSNQIMGITPSILTQLAAAPGAKPELRFLASIAASAKATYANRVRIVNDARLRRTNLAAALDSQPQADTVRRLRLSQANARSTSI